MHRQRFGWKDDRCGCWDNNGGQGTSALSPNVWICQRRIDSYFECVHVNELKENKKKESRRERDQRCQEKGTEGSPQRGGDAQG